MTDRNPCVWFEIPVNDLERAKAFYEHVLGWELTVQVMGPAKMAWFPMVPNAPGSAGCLLEGEGYEPSHAGSMVYLHVDAIEPCVERLEAKGGKVLNPKMSIGQFGFVAHFEDCEGNRVALHADQ